MKCSVVIVLRWHNGDITAVFMASADSSQHDEKHNHMDINQRDKESMPALPANLCPTVGFACRDGSMVLHCLVGK
jgi:hypothetical protein